MSADSRRPDQPAVLAGTIDSRAMYQATLAARRMIARSKNPRDLIHSYRPTSVAYHVAYVAIEAYQRAGGGRLSGADR
jgi:hypothetical protein